MLLLNVIFHVLQNVSICERKVKENLSFKD